MSRIPEGTELIDLVNAGEYICNNCGAIMDREEDPDGGCDILICPNCGEQIDEMDYEYEWDNEDEENWDSNEPPKGCQECGGPYPQCISSCSMYED